MDIDFLNIINAIWRSFSFLSEPIGLLASLFTIGTTIIAIVAWILKLSSWQRNEMSKLSEIADNEKIRLIKSNEFIPTMGQCEPPHNGDNVIISSDRFSLLDKFLGELESKDNTYEKKRYIIMGGSGMGKSTFLAALFYKYIHKCKYRKCPYPIYVKSLGKRDVISNISKINDRKVNQSILLLDALDENIHASKDLFSFIEQLEEVSHDFRIVVITCRTQFFKDIESEPKTWSVPISGASNKRRISYDRIYISPFSDEEVGSYLKNKYGPSTEKYRKAMIISGKSIDIMSRPMILSFMDDLLDIDEVERIKTVEIYSKIIDKWFEREREIIDIEKAKLLSFSKKLAVYLYDKWNLTGDLFVTKEEYHTFIEDNGYKKDPYSFNERSLINRNSSGTIKFSHRSFWEYFIAVDSFEHPGRFYYMDHGLDTAELFHDEIYKLSVDAKYFECINYFDCSFSIDNGSFTDSNVKIKIREIILFFHQDLVNNPNDLDKFNYFMHLVYELYEMLLKRIRNLYSLLYDSNESRNLVTIRDFQKKEYLNCIYSLFVQIQDLFEISINYNIASDYIWAEFVPKLLTKYSQIDTIFSNIKMVDRPYNHERMFFPDHLPDESDGFVESIHLGYGFSSTTDMLKAISIIFEFIKPAPLLFVYVDHRFYEEIICYLEQSDIVKKQKGHIVFRVSLNNTIVNYFAMNHKTDNTNDNLHRISNTIQNMLKAKNYQYPK